MEERRHAARWQINQSAQLNLEDGIKPISCVVEDISIQGARLSLSNDFFPEVFANFRLSLSDDFEFNAGAKVAWSEKVFENNIYGLSFDRIEKSAREGITRYVKDNYPGEVTRQWWVGV